MLIGGPLNGKRGPIYGNDHCVDLELYDDAGNVTSVERYALGDNPTPTFRYHVGSQEVGRALRKPEPVNVVSYEGRAAIPVPDTGWKTGG